MKCIFVIAFFICVSARADRLEFAGYVATAEHVIFSLSDADTKDHSPWLKLGDTWRGYKLLSFEEDAQVLVVRREMTIQVLELRDSVIQKASIQSEEGAAVISAYTSAHAAKDKSAFTRMIHDSPAAVGSVTAGLVEGFAGDDCSESILSISVESLNQKYKDQFQIEDTGYTFSLRPEKRLRLVFLSREGKTRNVRYLLGRADGAYKIVTAAPLDSVDKE